MENIFSMGVRGENFLLLDTISIVNFRSQKLEVLF